jgi:hypothetical protein
VQLWRCPVHFERIRILAKITGFDDTLANIPKILGEEVQNAIVLKTMATLFI